MVAVNWLNDQPRPSWEDVLSRLRLVKLHPGDRGISLSAGDDDHLIAYYTEHGYLAEAHGSGEADFYALVDDSGSLELKSVWYAGDTIERPLRAFVNEETILRALRYYFETGCKDPELKWEIHNSL